MADVQIADDGPKSARGSDAKSMPGAKLIQVWSSNAGPYVIWKLPKIFH